MVNRTRVEGGGYIKYDIIHNMINRRVVTTFFTIGICYIYFDTSMRSVSYVVGVLVLCLLVVV